MRCKLLVQPPFNATKAAIAFSISDGVEQGVGAVNGTADTAHALVTDSGLNCGARRGVVQCHGATTVWVSIRLSAHELVGQSD